VCLWIGCKVISANEDNDINLNGDGFIVTDRNSLLEKLKNMDK
jgi:hypothetical protein